MEAFVYVAVKGPPALYAPASCYTPGIYTTKVQNTCVQHQVLVICTRYINSTEHLCTVPGTGNMYIIGCNKDTSRTKGTRTEKKQPPAPPLCLGPRQGGQPKIKFEK